MAMTRPHATLVLLLCAPLVARGSLFDMTRKEAEAPLVRRTGDGYTSEGYGVDTSFPMHHDIPKGTWGDAMYKEFINGCANKFKMGSCRSNEESRMAMNATRSAAANFTGSAAKIRAPRTTSGGILATHVDRLPLVTSCIINVDQDVDEPWPIEVVGHDGVAYNVTLEPGDMALYESHTVLHGRPFPLKGNFFANVFVHFIPVDPNDHNQNHPDIDFSWTKNARIERAQPAASRRGSGSPTCETRAAGVSLGWARGRRAPRHGRQALAQTGAYDHRTVEEGGAPLPKPGSLEGRAARAARGGPPRAPKAALNEEPGHQVVGGEDFGADAFATGTLSLHAAAANGDVDTLRRELERDPDAVNAPDENLWTPLHEAARAGDLETVEFLVEHGANIADTTISGSSALWIAKQNHHNRVATFFSKLGAPDIADHDL
ncbi:ATPase [Aureococcus anophagefferens]|nr:ATPase [Aureococcus anophagefferens]